jgi:general secretion pathway protein K
MKLHKKNIWSKLQRKIFGPQRGMMLLIIGVTIVTSSSLTAFQFFKTTHMEFKTTLNEAVKLQAHYCAKTGFQAATMGLLKIKEKFLYQYGVMNLPIPLTIGNCSIWFIIVAEDGKINVNYLVRDFDGSQSDITRPILDNLFESLDLPSQEIDKIVDYIDSNDDRMPSGLEKDEYLEMSPPAHIKNDFMFSFQEILTIPGMTYSMFMESRKPPDYEETHSDDFLTEIELAMKTDDDWILANNITAFARNDKSDQVQVNVNAAGYFVLKAIDPEVMTDAAIKRIVELRESDAGYISSLSKIQKFPEFLQTNSEGLSYFDLIKNRLKTKGRYFKIVGYGSLDNHPTLTSSIQGILDRDKKSLIWYKEF